MLQKDVALELPAKDGGMQHAIDQAKLLHSRHGFRNVPVQQSADLYSTVRNPSVSFADQILYLEHQWLRILHAAVPRRIGPRRVRACGVSLLRHQEMFAEEVSAAAGGKRKETVPK